MSEQQIHLHITGMTCGHCERAVASAILEVGGVKSATADHKNASADVTFDPAVTNEAAIRDAVNELVVYQVVTS